MQKEFDFIAIGDTVTDEFIALKDAEVHCKIDTEACELCVRFGDKVPYENVETVYAVGNAANAAVSAARLGLQSALAADIGDDELGTKMLETLTMHGVGTGFVRIHEGMESNHHYVLRYQAERTILIRHHEYPYALPAVGHPRFIYLSSLAEHSLSYHHEIAKYLSENTDTFFAFQPGTFQIKLGAKELEALYKEADIFFCNKEEAARILGHEHENITDMLKQMSELGPKIVVVTDGPKGAYAYDSKDGSVWRVPMYPDPKPPLERTGAGDAFASTVVAALALGEPLEKALAWGPINSMSVVQYVGAQRGLLTREQIERHLKEAPPEYRVEKMS
ncbi:MAG: carbohydrate kinase family protein [Patescibacteria group bacterium]